jgi:hypothetical protein
VKRVVMSVGLCLFNLLGSSSSFSNMVASSFVCVVILPLYFQLIFVTSSRAVVMPRSACTVHSRRRESHRKQMHVISPSLLE